MTHHLQHRSVVPPPTLMWPSSDASYSLMTTTSTSTTFHLLPDDGSDAAFHLEEVVGEGLTPLATPSAHTFDLHFGFDDLTGAMISSAPAATSLPSPPTLTFAAPQLGGVQAYPSSGGVPVSPLSYSGEESDASSTPSTPPPLSPTVKSEPVSHVGYGYASPGGHSYTSASSSPDHHYELDPVPGVPVHPPHSLTTPMAALPVAMPHHLTTPTVSVAQHAPIPATVSGAATGAARVATKRRRPETNPVDDNAKGNRVSWVPANQSKDDGEGDEEDDDDGEGDVKSKGRRGKAGSTAGGAAGKASKRERNKISASKYRKRRKQYLDGLEGKVGEMTSTLTAQTKKIAALNAENKLLKEQVEFLKNLLCFNSVKVPPLPNKLTNESEPVPPAPMAHAVRGVGSATGVLLFAFFACFVLLAPPWQGSGMSSIVFVREPVSGVMGGVSPLGRTLLWEKCETVLRDNGCLEDMVSTLPGARPPGAAVPSSSKVMIDTSTAAASLGGIDHHGVTLNHAHADILSSDMIPPSHQVNATTSSPHAEALPAAA